MQKYILQVGGGGGCVAPQRNPKLTLLARRIPQKLQKIEVCHVAYR